MRDKKYNVILIGIDTLRADHLGCYGYKRPTSPVIDAFAKESLFFKNCFSQAPVTAPSFMSIFTSRYPTCHGVLSNIGTKYNLRRAYILDRRIPVFTEVLKKLEYRTAAFTDGGNLYGKLGFSRGFDYYSENPNRSRSVGAIPQDDIFYWLREHARENFFLFLHTYAVHNPWFAPKSYQKLFDPTCGDHIKNPPFRQTLERRNIKVSPYHYFLSQIDRDSPDNLFHFKALYDGAIKYVDDFVGNLMELLGTLKLTDSTIVVFTSDHGEEFFDHGMLGHKQLYNELLRVPLIIMAPGFSRAFSTDQIVRSIDIIPTILDILGMAADFSVQGASLTKMFDNDLNFVAIAETERHGYSVQNKTHKYIWPRYKNYPPHMKLHAIDNRVNDIAVDELYDLTNDPQEKNNIAIKNLDIVEVMLGLFDSELNRIQPPRPRKKVIFLGTDSDTE